MPPFGEGRGHRTDYVSLRLRALPGLPRRVILARIRDGTRTSEWDFECPDRCRWSYVAPGLLQDHEGSHPLTIRNFHAIDIRDTLVTMAVVPLAAAADADERSSGPGVSDRQVSETQNPGIEGSSGKGSVGGGGSVGSWISGRPGMSGEGSGASGVAGGAALSLSVSAVGA